MNNTQRKKFVQNIREILNDWDFLGIGQAGPADEYDCLAIPLERLLEEKACEKEIGDFLLDEVKKHFNVDVSRAEVSTIAKKILSL